MTWHKESQRHKMSRQGIKTKKLELGNKKVVPMFEYGEARGSAYLIDGWEKGKAIRLTNGNYLFMTDSEILGMAQDPKNPEQWIADYAFDIPADNFRLESKTPSGEFTRAIKKVMYND
jgi:hypothetical protein